MTNTYFNISIIIGCIIGLLSCQNKSTDDPLSDKVKVKTERVKKINTSFPVHSSGKLASQQEVKLSFKTGGIIKKIYVTEGQQVKKGVLLAQLDLTEIQAKYNKAQAMLNKTQRDFKRIEALYQDSVATLENYQDAKTALTTSKEDMQIATFNLNHSKIIAPSDGCILKIIAESNEITSPGHPVILFGSTNTNWIIKTSVTDKDAAKLNIHDSCIIQFDAYPQKKFNGRVTLIPSSTNSYTSTLDIEIMLKQRPPSFISGLIATIDIYPSTNKEYLKIPVDAMIEAIGNTGFVYEVVDQKPVKRKIYIEDIREKYIFTTKGIRADAEIITSGAHYIDEKKKIEIHKRSEK